MVLSKLLGELDNEIRTAFNRLIVTNDNGNVHANGCTGSRGDDASRQRGAKGRACEEGRRSRLTEGVTVAGFRRNGGCGDGDEGIHREDWRG